MQWAQKVKSIWVEGKFIGECSEHATCTDTDGSYACICKNGFIGDGFQCTNIDECENAKVSASQSDDGPSKRICSEFAHCIDTVGSYKCECWKGYSGDGVTCENINECQTIDPTQARSLEELLRPRHECDRYADCTDNLGSYICECIDGFTGDGLICNDVNECDLHMHDCHTLNANCTNLEGTYECKCHEGYGCTNLTRISNSRTDYGPTITTSMI